MTAVLEIPTSSEQRLASQSIVDMDHILRDLKGKKTVMIEVKSDEGHSIKVPVKVFKLLLDILSQMAKGNAISIVPSEAELSTQQAADMLNVSRPFLVKMLKQEKIPFKQVGRHRRILLEDLLAYMKHQDQVREKALQALADQAQELDMGY